MSFVIDLTNKDGITYYYYANRVGVTVGFPANSKMEAEILARKYFGLE